MAEQRTTSASGAPVAGDERSRTVGPNGPTALQDTYVVQQMQHFNRERVHERVVHAKGSAAHGFLEVTITACEAPGPRRLGPIDPRLAPGADRVLPVEVERVRHFLPKSIVDRREWHDGSFCISRWDTESLDLGAGGAEGARCRLPGVRPAPDRIHRRADRLSAWTSSSTSWSTGRNYLAPWINDIAPGPGQEFMYLVGGVEILEGFLVAIKPRYGAPVIVAWLAGIIVNLLTIPGFYDVALRDFGLLLGALTLARLAWSYDTR